MVLVNACFSSKMNITTTCLNIIFIRYQFFACYFVCLFVFVLLLLLFVCLDFLELPEL